MLQTDVSNNDKNSKKSSEDMNVLLGREKITEEIQQILQNFDENCKNIHFKKGIYIYGSTGCGKSEFVMNLLKEMDYDIIRYDAGDVRNKSLIDTITSNSISNRNVLHMMQRKVKKIAIVMDEIDGMNNGDKGGITSLIKLIRQKKTKKQKSEDVTLNPIICIGNYFMDKKIKELMKICNVFELKSPTDDQITKLLKTIPLAFSVSSASIACPGHSNPRLPGLSTTCGALIEACPSWSSMCEDVTPELCNQINENFLIKYIQGDLRKFMFIKRIYERDPEILKSFSQVLKQKTNIEDSKKITKGLINHSISINEHNTFMNETDRTIVALLWHENIIDVIEKEPIEKSFTFYSKILDNMCFSDYMDRITFQNQIWQFNEMSSMMKTFYNNKLYHETFPRNEGQSCLDEIRFTKVLTKYSTEYNNQLFIYNMCQELDMDKKDMIAFFQELRLIYGSDFLAIPDIAQKMEEMFENYNINKLDIKRIYRYLDKNVKKESGEIDFGENDCDNEL